MKTVLVLVLALACSDDTTTPRHYHLNLTPGFSDDQSDAIFDAATEWQSQSGGFVTFDGAPSDVDVITVYPATSDQIVAEFGGGAIGIDETNGDSSTISIVTSLDPVTFHQTALHELGHALGLVHMTPGNVMCANTDCATLQVTCGDLGQLTHHTVTGCYP
jgi:predicted Zn-dependent protease